MAQSDPARSRHWGIRFGLRSLITRCNGFESMTLGETLISVWQQVLVEENTTVELNGSAFSIGSTRAKKLRMVRFRYGDHQIDGIEQNQKTTSRWVALARDGKRVMQFSYQNHYIGNVCEVELTRYPAWQALGLPE